MKRHSLFLLLLLLLFNNIDLFSQEDRIPDLFSILDQWERLDDTTRELVILKADGTYRIENYTWRRSGYYYLSSLESGSFYKLQSGLMVFNPEMLVKGKDTIQCTESEKYINYKFLDKGGHLSLKPVTKYKQILGNRKKIVGSTFTSLKGDTLSFTDFSQVEALQWGFIITEDAFYVGQKNKVYNRYHD